MAELGSRPTLCLVADRPTLGARLLPALTEVLAALPRGRVMVIDRGEAEARARLSHLAELIALCRAHGAPVLVSTRVDLALAAGADGVHLPEHGLPAAVVRATWPMLLVGRSCHDRQGLLAAEDAGAHYALLSPVAAPHSKPLAAETLGVAGFARAVAGLTLSVYALGGIVPDLVAGLRHAGAAGVAALGGVLGAPDPAVRARGLVAAWDHASPEPGAS